MSPLISRDTTLVVLSLCCISAALVLFLSSFLFIPPPPRINVALIGNSMLFVNDVPRLLEKLSRNSITQDSCLHGALNLRSILKKGNGMYNKWRTENARIRNVMRGSSTILYDFGACTVTQLLYGHDDNLELYNNNSSSYYTNDHKNPCFRSEPYYQYRQQLSKRVHHHDQWNYIIVNDQSKRPAKYSTRQKSLKALKKYYVDYFIQTGATPILLATHGYLKSGDPNNNDDSSSSNDPFKDIATFTSNVYQGYLEYAKLLAQYLPTSQQPRIAPSGLAFLYIYEQNYEFYKKLFFVDNYHPSPHGSYLIGLCLYATIYGEMPSNRDGMVYNVKLLYKNARRMQLIGKKKYIMPLPTYAEAQYLYEVARKITLQGVLPESLILYDDSSSNNNDDVE